MQEGVAVNKRVADRLLDAGVIDETDYMRAIEFARARSSRVEEALLALEIVDEAKLLKFIATLHRTQFVSSEKLSRAKLDDEALRVVTRQTARHFGVYPLLLDRKADRLVVATADPDNPLAERELRLAARVQTVAFMVARPAAVLAAIARGYEHDKKPFKRLLMARPVKVDPSLLMHDPFSAREKGAARPHEDGLRSPPAAKSEPGPRGAVVPPRAAGTSEPGRLGAMAPPPTAKTSEPGRRAAAVPSRAAGKSESLVPAPVVPSPAAREDEVQHSGSSRLPPPRRERTGDLLSCSFEIVPDSTSEAPAPQPLDVTQPRGLGIVAQSARQAAASAPPLDPRREAPTLARPPKPASPTPARAHPSVPHAPAAATHGSPQAALPRPAPAPIPPRGLGLLNPNDPHESDANFDPLAVPGRPSSLESTSSADTTIPPPPTSSPSVSPPSPRPRSARSARGDTDSPAGEVTPSPQILELVRVFVGLLDHERDHLRDHSALVARLALAVCERIRLPDRHKLAVVVAAQLHDLGKMADHHLTLLNVALFPTHRERGEKLAGVPRHLLESVGLPEGALAAIDAMYEQVDGHGLPMGLTMNQIPIGARIVAIADSYADLTSNPRNPFQRLLRGDEAIAVLREHAGTVFDAQLVDVFANTAAAEPIRSELPSYLERVLPVEPDPERRLAKVATRGVSGSLGLMNLTDIVQILAQGRKSCVLRIHHDDAPGEIHFRAGKIVHAVWPGFEGEQAFYRLVALREQGDFYLAPSEQVSKTTIDASPEYLLLEAMRLIDEGRC